MRLTSPCIALLIALLVTPLHAQSTRPITAADAPLEPHTYKHLPDRDLHIYILHPDGAKPSSPRPAIVFFHGGAWISGKPTQFLAQAQHFASRGAVCLLVEYRLLDRGGKSLPTVCIQDAKSAMRWTRAHSAELGIDPHRIASAGGSAGGHLAAAVSMLPGLDDPNDDLSVSPRSDAMLLFNPVFNNGPGQWGYGRVGDRYKEFSPAHHVSPTTPPAVVFLGDHDQHIPVQVITDFKSAMDRAGVRCDTHVYPNQAHGFFNHRDPTNPANDYLTQTTQTADAFLTSLGWLPPAPTTQPAVP